MIGAMPMFALFPGFAAAVAVASAGPPTAAELRPRLDPPSAAVRKLDLSRLSSRFDDFQAQKMSGVARTSLDRELPRSAATASLGFLCGVQPTPNVRGGAGALGADADGRFLGAQMRFRFH